MNLFEFDRKNKTKSVLIGTDEAGRGPLAGCVVAAAVCFPEINKTLEKDLNKLNDSKKLTDKIRRELFEPIKSNSIYSICEISVEEIEKINILQAALKAMKISCLNVADKVKDEFEIFVDGKIKIPYNFNQRTIVKGDGTSASIAAASILAKVYRDDVMSELAKEYPQYDWENDKGYGTKKHIDAILKYGTTPYHRMSFLTNILSEQLTLF